MAEAAFSEAWASALGVALRTSDSYRKAAQLWEGAVVLDWSDAPAARRDAADGSGCGVFLELDHGDCHAARMATSADYETARFVLSADLDAWDTMLAGKLAPTMAILRGKLKLRKGSMGALMPLVGAATEMLRVAQGVDLATLGAGDVA